MDFHECVFNENFENQIDLTSRPRYKDVEQKCDCANDYLDLIMSKLYTVDFEMNKTISVKDDLGLGIIEIPYTYCALLAQANSHTIHHYTIINYIFDRLEIVLDDAAFGYNPTTPKQEIMS